CHVSLRSQQRLLDVRTCRLDRGPEGRSGEYDPVGAAVDAMVEQHCDAFVERWCERAVLRHVCIKRLVQEVDDLRLRPALLERRINWRHGGKIRVDEKDSFCHRIIASKLPGLFTFMT